MQYKAPTRHCLSQAPRQAVVCRGTDLKQTEYVVLGCGIIGLACARQLLQSQPSASVTVLDESHELTTPSRNRATTAGQGYIWQAHRDHKHQPAWELASRGVALWREELAACTASETSQKHSDHSGIESSMHGSLLLSNDHVGVSALSERAEALQQLGFAADLLSAEECMAAERLVHIGSAGAGLRVTSDFHIDAATACMWLLARCHELGRHKSRFRIMFGTSINGVCKGPKDQGVEVETSAGRFHAIQGAIVALGAASGSLIADSFKDEVYRDMLKKRWGLLIRVPYPSLPDGMQPLRLGLMEAAYSKHYSRADTGVLKVSSAEQPKGVTDLTFTACTGASGQLLLGSSRHEGPNREAVDEEAVAAAIIEQACEHMPMLAAHLRASRDDMQLLWGPRPASCRGLPYISRVAACEGLIIAAGHEGSGLTMALSTAELVNGLISGHDLPAYSAEFAL